MDRHLPRTVIALALLLGVLTDLLFDRSLLGLNVPIGVAALLGTLTWLGRRRGRPDPADLWLPAVAMLAALVVAARTDGVIVGLNLLLAAAAVAAWSYAAAGVAVTRRAVTAVVELGIWASMAILGGSASVLGHAAAASGASGARAVDRLGRAAPVVRGILLALPVLIVFAALLSSADAVFARLMADILQVPFDPSEVVRRAIVVLVAAWLIGGTLAITSGLVALPRLPAPAPLRGWWSRTPASRDRAGADAVDGDDGDRFEDAGTATSGGAGSRRPVASTEAVVVLAAVDLLFAVFVVLQLAYLFGGGDTLAATGQPYSAYARSGYFELVAVVILAGGLLMVGSVLAGRGRAFVASALVLLGLTGLILVSAAVRLSLYLQAYGWTELRFYVGASIAWLAIAGVLATLLLVRDRMRWLIHGLVMAAIAITLGVSVLGPQAFVTGQNVARVLDPSLVPPDGYAGFDVGYLLTLDDDAIPALVASLGSLGPDERQDVLEVLLTRRDRLAAELAEAGPVSWNLARERAREALAALPDR
ncbi:MAG: DUF4173 domain-containing protein [Chloroflexota bacterium]|nr:MAG: DUF4173 domain-containing protein [Chloroflexota bacterium]